MKKLILIPITLTALAPTIAMVGCNKPTPTEKIQFTTVPGQMTSPTVGTFQLDWAPTYHNIEFVNDWAFTSSCGNTINIVADESRPATITLTFNEEITKNNITDGELTFTYNDLTTKEDNIPVILKAFVLQNLLHQNLTLNLQPLLDKCLLQL